MSSFLETIGENAFESAATGLTGAALSKFVLKRESYVDLFGLINLPEWQVDGLLLVAESAFADLAGEWAIPMVQEKLTGSEELSNAIAAAAPPAFTGIWHAGIKLYALDTYGTATHEILLGAGSKLAGNQIASMFV